jgi:hypothetical protein
MSTSNSLHQLLIVPVIKCHENIKEEFLHMTRRVSSYNGQRLWVTPGIFILKILKQQGSE